MPRIGIEEIRAVVVEDRDGVAERLDVAVQRHADTHVDPWTQGRDPMTPGQFRTAPAVGGPAARPRRPGQRAARGFLVRLGSIEQIPYGEGRAVDVERDQVAVFRLRNG